MSKSQVEQTLEDLNVDVENIKNMYEDNSQKIIPREWYRPIIDTCVELCGVLPEHVNHNEHDRVVTITFDLEETAQRFEEGFHSNVLKSMNEVIRSKGELPKTYNRGMVLETSQEGISFIINY